MTQRNLFTEKKIMDLEHRFMVAKGEGEGVGWIGTLGLIDSDSCLWIGSHSNEILLCNTGHYV